ncbi:MAG: hypothetical protein QOJ07_1313 [Thermoleophilaceae bacterium]|jgi:hypothetical protein|nr:hypothetical protein [Thermoleophilaceae bacterium]
MVSPPKKARAWVLDHETKGTGAQMVPLEKLEDSDGSSRGALVVKTPAPRPEKAPEPAGPRRFKVVDVMTRQVLAENVDARAAVTVLEGMRSVVDVNLYLWQYDPGEWRQLSQRERAMVWGLRNR